MTRMNFRSGAGLAALLAAVGTAVPVRADVDLEFRPATQKVAVGEVVRAGLYAVSDHPTDSEFVAAIDMVFSWNPDELLLLGLDETDAVPLLASAFLFDDLFGLNETIPPADGNGFYLAFAELETAIEATPEGALITTFEFEALQAATDSPITIETELQVEENPPGRTRVLAADPPGVDITGELRSATVDITDGTGCPEDIDGSGSIDFGDLLQILSDWGDKGGPADIDGSGVVDFGDILLILSLWGPCP